MEMVLATGNFTGSQRDAPPDDVVVADRSMVKVFDLARRLAKTPTTVLILGETGVGKEIVAERLHRWSPRAAAPFVRLNCASLPEALLESELFGYEQGAFTGAARRKVGYFEAASGGTLLLDEIGELTPSMQVKLLRVLESQRLKRLGSTEDVVVDVRLVCATHRNLAAACDAGTFRQDLFYRISTVTIDMPPLRERPVEIALLAQLFVRQFAAREGVAAPRLHPDALAALGAHGWPGNVRELRNAVEHAFVLRDRGLILAEHLPKTVVAGAAEQPAMRDRIEQVERANIEAALAASSGNRTHAAARLGISRRALIYKIAKYGLGDPQK
jgi:transcriptional regulator with PAS, ATPase and Fis domain